MKRLWLLLLLIVPIFAFGSIGKITVLKGDVTLKRGADVIKAKSGTLLEKKDFITTDKNGKVQILFSDKTIFTIGKSSTLDIADYLYDEAKPRKNKAKFNVLKGAFSSITGRIGKLNKSKFKLKTKSASIGIRGTIVKANQEIVMCTEGAITVETENGVAVRLEAGQKTNVASGTPTAPEAIGEGDVEALDVDVAEGEGLAEAAAAETPAEEAEPAVTEEVTTQVEVTENVNEKEKEEAFNYRNETLTGRSINPKDTTSGSAKQQEVTIEASNIQGDFSLGNSADGLEMVDDSGQKIDSTKDTTITWGHWNENGDTSKKWVAGKQTDVQIIDNMKDSEQTINAQYAGKVMGTVNSTDDIKMDETNRVEMNFQLGAATNNMDGSMEFETEGGQSWNAQFGSDSAVDGNSFSAGATGGTAGDQNLKSGGLDGNFYGENAEAVGGTFELNTDADKATGVFKADKQ